MTAPGAHRGALTGVFVGVLAGAAVVGVLPVGVAPADAESLNAAPGSATDADVVTQAAGSVSGPAQGPVAERPLPGGGSRLVRAHEVTWATWAEIDLLSEGVRIDAAGNPVAVVDGVPALRIPAGQNAWIAAGTVPGPARYRAMATQALRDLDALVLDDGSVLAAPSPGWDYMWPRDSSFVAVALARTGHQDEAFAVLSRLAELHATSSDGVFEARYVPQDGSVPDDRGRQLDGCGWALWAVGEWYAASDQQPDAASAKFLAVRSDALEPMVRGCLEAIDQAVDVRSGLPGPWSDYWEVEETSPTLGTVAALQAGVLAVRPVVARSEDVALVVLVDELAVRLGRGVESFAPGFPRHQSAGDLDASVTFLMPPFVPVGSTVFRSESRGVDEDVLVAWGEASQVLARPAGGLAPGQAWRQDGVSWTPTTALFALTAAASGDTSEATRWLDWLDGHRTRTGSLPEKVLGGGEPAAVAPLAWTCALVLITLDELDQQ